MESRVALRHQRMAAATAERKARFKLYKNGKQWAVAGVVTLAFGMAWSGTQSVAAATADGGTTASASADSATTSAPAQSTTTSTEPQLTVSAAAVNQTIQAGNNATYRVSLNTTGIKTTLHEAKLTLQLPTGDGVALTTPVSELAIGGVTPTYDATSGVLTYDFGTLDAGISADVVLGVSTPKSATANGQTLTMSGSFTSTEQTVPLAAQTVTLAQAAKVSATNSYAGVTASNQDDYDHVNPNPGDTIKLALAANVPTTQGGTELLKAGSDIKVTYTLAKELTYTGMASDSAVQTAPTVTKNADGTTTLDWTFTAPSAAAQTEQDVNFKLAINALVDASLTKLTTVQTQAVVSVTTDEDKQVVADPAVATVSITPYNPRAGVDEEGTYFPPVLNYGSTDGVSGVNTSSPGANADPTVYTEDSPVLRYRVLVDEGMAPTTENANIKYLAVHLTVDPNETLQVLSLGKGYYYPDTSTPNQALSYYPYITLAVKYAGEGDNVYHVLQTDIATSATATITRAQLIAWGLDPDQAIVDVYLFYHLTDDADVKIPPKVDTFFSRQTKADGTEDLYNSADYTGFPTDSGAPTGYLSSISVTTSVNAGYTGQITHGGLVQYDMGDDEYENYYFARMFDESDYEQNGDPLVVSNSLMQTVEVASRPEGVERTLYAKVGLSNADTNNQVVPGPNQLALALGISADSLANLVATNTPFTSYVLLPKGVTYNASTTAYPDAVSVVTEDYNGSGQELVKYVWSGQYIFPGTQLAAQIGVDIASDAAADLVFKMNTDVNGVEFQVATTDQKLITNSTKQADATDIDTDGDDTEDMLVTGAEYGLVRTTKVQTNGSGATTTIGANGTYTVTTTANTEDTLSSLSLLDVLPTQGDSGLTTTDLRNSDFTPTLTGPITLPDSWQGQVTVEYTTTDGVTLANASDATWIGEQAVTDWSKVTAFRVTLDATSGKTIAGGAQSIEFTVKTPANARDYSSTGDQTAYNTFAVATNGLAVTEPLAAALTVSVPDVSTGQLIVKRTIHYVDAKGQTVAPDVVQSVTYRTMTNDSTGETIYTPTGRFASVASPTVAGYTPDVEQVNAAVPVATMVTPSDTESTVVYKADTQTIVVKLVDQAGSVLKTLTFTGASGSALSHTEIAKAIQTQVFAGYVMDNDETPGVKFDSDSATTQYFTVKFSKVVTKQPATPSAQPASQEGATFTASSGHHVESGIHPAQAALPTAGDAQQNLLAIAGTGMLALIGLAGLGTLKRKQD